MYLFFPPGPAPLCLFVPAPTPVTQSRPRLGVIVRPERPTNSTWAQLSCNRHSLGFITFYGDKGALDLGSKGSYTIYEKDGAVVKKTMESTYGDIGHAQNFLAAIRNDKPLSLNVEIEEGHKSTLMCHLGNIAYRTGRSLSCDPSNGHIKNDPEAMKYWSREYAEGWEPKV